MKRNQAVKHSATRLTPPPAAGFTLLEMVIVVAVGIVLTVIAIPALSTAMMNARINSAVSDFTAALSSARYQAIRDSNEYTLVLTAPANTYVLTNTVTTKSAFPNPVPLSSYVVINGGSGSFTYTLCPNGMVYGTGGCPSATAAPALSFVYQTRQINLAISETGNVSTTVIH